MAGDGLVIIAIDGVDKVGKSTLCKALAEVHGFNVISVDSYRIEGIKMPLDMRFWGDIPAMAVARLSGVDILLDRSMLSVLAYNVDPIHPGNKREVYDQLYPYVGWYKEKVFFVFNTFMDTRTLTERNPEADWKELVYDNNCFINVYGACGIDPLVIQAETAISYKMDQILDFCEYNK